MSNEYHCPNCGAKIGFGEAICPSCNADVTSVWDQASTPKNDGPKVAPGSGGMPSGGSPFPPAAGSGGSPFPPTGGSGGSPFPPTGDKSSDGTPFPPAGGSGGSPFPPASGSGGNDQKQAVPGTGSSSPAGGGTSPFPSPSPPNNSGASPFPPTDDSTPSPSAQPQSGPHFEIERIGAKLFIPEGENAYGRHEIQGIATIALPDMNAYNNISRKHFYMNREEDKVSIEDKGSTNGTYIGTKKITGQGPHPLKDGDKVILPIEENGQMVQLEMTYKKS